MSIQPTQHFPMTQEHVRGMPDENRDSVDSAVSSAAMGILLPEAQGEERQRSHFSAPPSPFPQSTGFDFDNPVVIKNLNRSPDSGDGLSSSVSVVCDDDLSRAVYNEGNAARRYNLLRWHGHLNEGLEGIVDHTPFQAATGSSL